MREETKNTQKETKNTQKQKGFTLIELVIVIAVIGILAVLIAPRGGEVFKDAQIVTVSEAINTLKTATVQYATKNKALPANEAALVQARLLDASALKSIAVNHATAAYGPAVAGNVAGAVPANGFDLDGDATVDTTANENVMQVVLTGVLQTDAYSISLTLDGNANSPGVATVADTVGRVEYPAIAAAPATGNVTIYVDAL